jgi:limonene-1,2-epoxide hydrolase
MSQNQSDVVRAFLKVMEVLDYPRAVALVTSDCTYTNPPPIGTVHGPEGIRAVLEPFLRTNFEFCAKP